jgi:hypothetical protein
MVRTSPAMLNMWPCLELFLTSKFSYYFFPSSPIKLKLALQIVGRLLIATPPGPIKLCSQSTAGVRLCCAFYQPQQTVQKCWVKTILLSQTACFDFSSSNFNLQGHLLSAGGVALSNSKIRSNNTWVNRKTIQRGNPMWNNRDFFVHTVFRGFWNEIVDITLR